MNFDYYVLAMLSRAPEHTLRMTELARQTPTCTCTSSVPAPIEWVWSC
jgi:hypothetical protein